MLFKKRLIAPEKIIRYGLLMLSLGLILYICLSFLPGTFKNASHFIMGLLVGCGAGMLIGGMIYKNRK